MGPYSGQNHGQSSRNSASFGMSLRPNPYAMFRFCCTNLYTKDHAQLCGVVSFSLFLCLVVISLVIFGALSIFYIVVGVVVYSLLMKSLFGLAEKTYVLFYLLYEAVQIGFYLALILYVALPLIFFTLPQQVCKTYHRKLANGTVERGEVCTQSPLPEEYMELLLFILILVSVKLYFARVFAHFYKYLAWNEKELLHSAQYINGRGVQIAATGHLFPPPPPGFWDNPVVRDRAYGYDQPLTDVPSLLAELPSYAQAIGHQKVQQQNGTAAGIVEMDEVGGSADNGNAGNARLNLHV